MNNQYLLVVERSESQLVTSKTNDKYVLEGVFSECGVKNNNNRIYDEKEILPHINELKKLCDNNKLLGELDHPKSFDISLKNASHIIEDLRYDKDTRQVIGRIRLLNTDAGKNAMALVDAGVPLHISSRAAGVVESNGHVKIKKMFTYDLVANPGFENAELKRVNESYGFDNDGNVQLFEVPWQLTVDELQNQPITEIKENKEMDSTKYISIEDFNQYTKVVKNEFEALKTKLTEASSNSNNDAERKGLVKYTESIAKQVNTLQDTLDKVNESVDGLVAHNDYIIENLERVKNYAELVGERSNQGINYSEKLTESVDHLIEYVRTVAETTDKGIEYTRIVAEKADQGIEFAKYVANESSNRWSYQTEINEQLDKVISHNDYIIEGIDSVIKYTEYGVNETEKLQSFVDFTVKTINEGSTNYIETPVNQVENVEVKSTSETPITESLIVESDDEFKSGITTQLNAILESAKSEKVEDSTKRHHFLNFLSESKRNQFDALSPEIKEKVVNKFSTSGYFGTAEAERLWESCFIELKPKLDWLQNMPSKHVASWNNLNESQKHAIKAQASVRLLESQYQIDDFWSTRDLRSVKPEESNNERPINESSAYQTDDAYMEAVRDGFRKRFKK
jgi:hypothetical protein